MNAPSPGYREAFTEEVLRTTRPLTRQPDYDAFWASTLAQARAVPLSPERVPYDYPSAYVDVFSISYNGFDGEPIKGWLLLPKFAEGKRPCVIRFHGGGGRRGNPADLMGWAAAGFAVLTIDPRGQGGATQDNRRYSSGAHGAFILRGILDKEEYYLRALYMDCVKAADFARATPEIDPERIIVEGASQGGACAMAVAAFDGGPILALPNVPTFCDFPSRIVNRQARLALVADWLALYPEHAAQALETLSYFDVINLADRVRCRVFASVGLEDVDAPAAFFCAAYNRIPGEREIAVYHHNGHGNVNVPHFERALRKAVEIARP